MAPTSLSCASASTTASGGSKPRSSRQAPASAAKPSGLWAPSHHSRGSPGQASSRPGQRARAKPSTTASDSISTPLSVSIESAASAVRAFASWWRPWSGQASSSRPQGATSAVQRRPSGPSPSQAVLTRSAASTSGASCCVRHPGDHVRGLAGGDPAHHRDLGLDDPGLLGGDLPGRAAQQFRVVHPDRGDDRERGLDHVGRVEPPAQAHLDHRPLDLARGEVVEGQRRADLEEGAVLALGQARDQREAPRQPPLVGPLAVHADALAEVHQVRRGEEPGADPGLAQHALHQRAHRALAVRARDVHRGPLAVGIAQGAEQRARAVEAELVAPAFESVQRFERLLEAHFGRGGSSVRAGAPVGRGAPGCGEPRPAAARREARGRAPEELEQASRPRRASACDGRPGPRSPSRARTRPAGSLRGAPRRWSGG